MTNPIVILGAGAFAREVHERSCWAINEVPPAWSFTRSASSTMTSLSSLIAERGPVLGGDDVLADLPAGTRYVIAIGDNRIRRVSTPSRPGRPRSPPCSSIRR